MLKQIEESEQLVQAVDLPEEERARLWSTVFRHQIQAASFLAQRHFVESHKVLESAMGVERELLALDQATLPERLALISAWRVLGINTFGRNLFGDALAPFKSAYRCWPQTLQRSPAIRFIERLRSTSSTKPGSAPSVSQISRMRDLGSSKQKGKLSVLRTERYQGSGSSGLWYCINWAMSGSAKMNCRKQKYIWRRHFERWIPQNHQA